MSLDLYIRSHHPVKHRGTGVFVRDNGQTRELKTIDEVKAHFPDADTSDIDIREWEDDELFHCNMTHNLTEMASHVPIEGTDGVCALPRFKDDPTDEPLTEVVDDNQLIDIDLLYREAKEAIQRSGQFEVMRIIFTESDIDKLYSILRTQSV